MSWFWRRKKDLLSPATASMGGVLYLGEGTQAGVIVTREKAQEIWAVHACITGLTMDVAQIPLHLYLKTKDGRNLADWTTEGKALVYGPNEYMTTQDWIEQGMIHLLTVGDHYARIGLVDGHWAQCFPIDDPARVKTMIVAGRKVHYWAGVANATQPCYPMLPATPPQTYRQEQMFHIHGPSPDGWSGRDLIDTHRQTLGLAVALYKSASVWFANGGQPRGILILPAGLKDPDIQKAKETFTKNYGGDNEWSVAAYSGGVDFKPISVDPEKSQALGSRQQVVKEIAALYRIPVWRLYGDTPPSEEARDAYYTDTLGPWLTRWRTNINKQLLLPYNPSGLLYCDFATESLLRMNLWKRMQAYKLAVDARIMNPNECRENENMTTYKGGETFLNPNTQDAASNAAALAAQGGSAGAAPASGTDAGAQA